MTASTTQSHCAVCGAFLKTSLVFVVVFLYTSINTTSAFYSVDIQDLTALIQEVVASDSRFNTTSQFYADLLMKQYKNQSYLTVNQLQEFIDSSSYKVNGIAKSNKVLQDVCHNSSAGSPLLIQCVENKCLNSSEIFRVHGISGDRVTCSQLIDILPAVVVRLQQNCGSSNIVQNKGQTSPGSAKIWGVGFLCVTLINLCALLGMVFIPLMAKSYYKRLLMFMVALGVGTLTGSSLLFLIPECFEMTVEDSPNYHDYIWKSTTVIGGVYMFFLTERILQSIMDKRKVSFPTKKFKDGDNADEYAAENAGSVKLRSRTRHDSTSMNMSFHVPEVVRERHDHEADAAHEAVHIPSTTSNESQLSSHPLVEKSGTNHEANDVTASRTNGKLTHHTTADEATAADSNPDSVERRAIKSVAWMVVFGDGVHNFIDGLSIGAAFTNSILAGVSVSIAVICEELPHELGDFAILLNSGMSMRQALLYNFLSACMCYLGLMIGILIGELTHGSPWIFAIAGGMFLYISLVDMLPEVNHAAQEEVKETGKMWPPFLIQNAGLLSGYGLMIFLASFTSKIDFESLYS